MRKMIFLALTLLFSVNAFATSANLGAAITKSIIQENKTSNNQTATMIYGGQDLSRSEIAIANESIWAGQPTLIG
jgi:hypothetical protein